MASNGGLANGSTSPPPGAAPAAALQDQQQQSPPGLAGAQQPAKQWDRASSVQAPSALATAPGARGPSTTGRSVKFADPVPDSEDGSHRGDDSNQRLSGSEGGAEGSSGRRPSKRSMPRRSVSSSALRSSTGSNEVSEAVLAKQAEILRSNKTGKLRMRRGGLDGSFAALQDALTQDGEPVEHVATRVSALQSDGSGHVHCELCRRAEGMRQCGAAVLA